MRAHRRVLAKLLVAVLLLSSAVGSNMSALTAFAQEEPGMTEEAAAWEAAEEAAEEEAVAEEVVAEEAAEAEEEVAEEAAEEAEEAASEDAAQEQETADAQEGAAAAEAVTEPQTQENQGEEVVTQVSETEAETPTDEVNENLITIFYQASEGGSVSVASEQIDITKGQQQAQGSMAIVNEGWHFLYWQTADQSAIMSFDWNFAPMIWGGETGDITYVAVFEKDAVTEQPAEAAEETAEETAMPAFSGEAVTAKGIRVTAEAGEGIFPEGTTMEVSDVSKDTAIAAAEDAMGSDTEVIDAVGVDITFKNADGEKIEPENQQSVAVTISLPKSEQLEVTDGEDAEFAVVHKADSGETEVVSENASESGASFDGNASSLYVIATASGYSSNNPSHRGMAQWGGRYEMYVGFEITLLSDSKSNGKYNSGTWSISDGNDKIQIVEGSEVSGGDAVQPKVEIKALKKGTATVSFKRGNGKTDHFYINVVEPGTNKLKVGHIDVNLDLPYTYSINGVEKSDTYTLKQEDYKNVKIYVLRDGNYELLNVTGSKNGEHREIRFNGNFDIGTYANQTKYKVTFEKTIQKEGIDIPISFSVSGITYWGSSNTCPMGANAGYAVPDKNNNSGIDVAPPGEGSAKTGQIIIKKVVTGTSVTEEDVKYAFTITDTQGNREDLSVSVGTDGQGSATLTNLGYGTYTITEVSPESVKPNEDAEYLSTTYRVGEAEANTEPATVTLSSNNLEGTVYVTNNYKENKTGSLTITKTVTSDDQSGVGEDQTYEFRVLDSNNNVVGTGKRTGSGEVEIDGIAPGTYTVVEVNANQSPVDGYIMTTTVDPAASKTRAVANPDTVTIVAGEKAQVNFANSYKNNRTSVSVKKVWVDNGNKAEKRPKFITVHVIANGDKENPVRTVEMKPDANNATTRAVAPQSETWTYTFENLEKYDNEGNEIKYTVEEVRNGESWAQYYTTKVESDNAGGFIITNKMNYVELTTSLSVKKVWVDRDNEEETRPGFITIKVIADGDKDNPVRTDEMKPDENGGWNTTISDLPMYDSTTGDEINYTIEEVQVEGYKEPIIEKDSTGVFVITNSLKWEDITTTVSGRKVWVDDGRAHNNANEVQLTLTGIVRPPIVVNAMDPAASAGRMRAVALPVPTWTVAEWDGNRFTFTVPKYDQYGNRYEFELNETQVEGYESKISVDATGSFVVTNTLQNKLEIIITPKDAEKIYGEDDDPEKFEADVTGLPDGYEIDFKVTRKKSEKSPTDDYENYYMETEFVGEYVISVSDVVIKKDDEDKTEFFDIETKTATFTIKQRPLTITLGEKEVTLAVLDTLPGRILTLDPTDPADVKIEGLAEKDVITLTNDLKDLHPDEVTSIAIYAGLTDVGEMIVTKEHVKNLKIERNPDVTGNYYIAHINGKLKVTGGTTPPPATPTTPTTPTTPATPTTPPTPPTTPDPVPVPEEAEVLGARRDDAETEPVAEVLGATRTTEQPEVLGARRAQTGDMDMTMHYMLLFGAAAMLTFFVTVKRKKRD